MINPWTNNEKENTGDIGNNLGRKKYIKIGFGMKMLSVLQA